MGDDEAGRGMLAHAKESGIDVSAVIITKTLSASVPCDDEKRNTQSNTTSISTSSVPSHPPVSAVTATYTAIHDSSGTLALAVADVRVISEVTPHTVREHTQLINNSQLVMVDGNLDPRTFNALLNTVDLMQIPLFFEPTSDHKCVLPILTGTISKVFTVLTIIFVIVINKLFNILFNLLLTSQLYYSTALYSSFLLLHCIL